MTSKYNATGNHLSRRLKDFPWEMLSMMIFAAIIILIFILKTWFYGM